MIVPLESFNAKFNCGFGCCGRLFLQDLKDYNRIAIRPVENPPCLSLVINPQFAASGADNRHRSSMWQPQQVTRLQLAKQ
jgi:hypothetical protein